MSSRSYMFFSNDRISCFLMAEHSIYLYIYIYITFFKKSSHSWLSWVILSGTYCFHSFR
jgi:hypothetical protein